MPVAKQSLANYSMLNQMQAVPQGRSFGDLNNPRSICPDSPCQLINLLEAGHYTIYVTGRTPAGTRAFGSVRNCVFLRVACAWRGSGMVCPARM